MEDKKMLQKSPLHRLSKQFFANRQAPFPGMLLCILFSFFSPFRLFAFSPFSLPFCALSRLCALASLHVDAGPRCQVQFLMSDGQRAALPLIYAKTSECLPYPPLILITALAAQPLNLTLFHTCTLYWIVLHCTDHICSSLHRRHLCFSTITLSFYSYLLSRVHSLIPSRHNSQPTRPR